MMAGRGRGGGYAREGVVRGGKCATTPPHTHTHTHPRATAQWRRLAEPPHVQSTWISEEAWQQSSRVAVTLRQALSPRPRVRRQGQRNCSLKRRQGGQPHPTPSRSPQSSNGMLA